MSQRIKLREVIIPPELMADTRLYMGDLPHFNRLITSVNASEGVETEDARVSLALRMAVVRFNAIPPPLDRVYNGDNFPNEELLIKMGVLEILRMNGLIEMRNKINFQDSNFLISLGDKAQDYMSWISSIEQQVISELAETKASINIDEAYGYINSPMDLVNYWGAYY
jgi:hypothetical protein